MGDFFIRRPTVAIVIAVVMVILGTVAIKSLPVSLYPSVVPPEIQINSTYQGADAVSVEQSVTTPLELKLNGVENMIYMRSINANDGTSSVRVSFDVGTNLDMANVLTQNRVSEATASLPEEVKKVGVSVKKSLSFPLMLIALSSPGGTYDSRFLSNYASLNLNDIISRIPGVGQVNLFGGSDYAMRVWIRPDQLTNLGITVDDILTAIRTQNLISPAGQIGGPPAPENTEFTYTVRLKGRLSSPEEFGEVIIKSASDGSLIKLRDIARVELGSQLYNAEGRLNGSPSAVIAIYQSPGSNALEVASQVRSVMEQAKERFPSDLRYDVSLDTTLGVYAGIEEILHTLFEALVLVIAVVFLFLQSFRATLIPILTVPISLVATFFVFPFLGFSINTLSLLALVLAIGIVVDDAIVVVEAVMHHIEKGLSPREATKKAMKEVTGPVIAMSLILAAVFIPVSFMGGISGQFYRQFAVTIAVSVLFSAVSAITLSPALCAMLLKSGSAPTGGFFARFNRAFESLTMRYGSAASFLARKPLMTAGVFCGVLGLLFAVGTLLPKGFVPEEDQGYVLANLQLPDSTSIQRTGEVAQKIEQILREEKGVEFVTTVNGFSLLSQSFSSNTAFFFVSLKPWGTRDTDRQILKRINARLIPAIAEGQAFAFGPPAIPGLGTGSGFSMFLQDRAGKDPQFLEAQTANFLATARKRSEIGSINSVFRASVPQFSAQIDSDYAYSRGVDLKTIQSALGAFLGGVYVNDFNKFGRQYRVYLQAEPTYRDSADDVKLFSVRSSGGEMLPLSTLVKMEKSLGPEYTNRFNLYRAAEVVGTPAPGYSSAQALAALEEVAKSVFSDEMGYDWNAISYQEKKAGTGIEILLLGMLFVFLILAAQYESWSLPFSVLLGTPFAAVGALGGLYLLWLIVSPDFLNNIFAQIGVLTLVGLAAKNAILIVEFARVKMAEGLEPVEAAVEAGKQRLRPILMTSFAFILGVVPLAIASGAGAEARKVIGNSVLSGMLCATILGVLFVPAFFVAIEKLRAVRRSR